MPEPEAGVIREMSMMQKWIIAVSVSVTTALILLATSAAFQVYVNQLQTLKDIEQNKALIRVCCEEGTNTRSDLRDLTTRFDIFLSNLEALLKSSERRLQRLEDRSQ